MSLNEMGLRLSKLVRIGSVEVTSDDFRGGRLVKRDDGRCFVCRSASAKEEHHLAPRHIFGREAQCWPRVEVCRGCHRRWHELAGI